MMMDNEKLCISLAKADSDEEVIKLLKDANYWDDESSWNYYGGISNNFSVIGNQQSDADKALVEKLINSVDAVLMKECYRKGIDPTSEKAPKDIPGALKEFFNISDGKLTNLDLKRRSELANNISLIATGEKSNPCYAVIDSGEGQTPNRMPDTLLSLNKDNKMKIPFVQGKFNMGSTGALQFCGKLNNLQLIISKRDPNITDSNDNSSNYWGFTIVRRIEPTGGLRNSTFKYLSPGGIILRFKADSLPLYPSQYPNAFGNSFYYGTYIKLYDYQLTGLKTMVKFDLYYRLSLLIPSLPLPIRMYERRKGYRADSYETVLSGLNVRLDEDKRDNIEDGYPSSSEIMIAGNKIEIQIYAFRKGQRDKYSKNEGLVFTINGQAHSYLSKSFFERKAVGMGYLADSILLMVDCTKLDGRSREDLFMASRDRFRSSPLFSEIEKQLEKIVADHPGLRELKDKRRKEEIESGISDNKSLQDALEKVIKSNPTLTKFLINGLKITNPFSIVTTGAQDNFDGKRYPTFFKLRKTYDQNKPKLTPINHRTRIFFETDAVNDYFKREDNPGDFYIDIEGITLKNYSLNMWNGVATLNFDLPDCVKVGDIVKATAKTDDINTINPFINEFYIHISPAQLNQPTDDDGGRVKPPSDKPGQERNSPQHLNLPNIQDVSREDWDKFNFNEESALAVVDSGGSGYDFYVNVDNIFLKDHIKQFYKVEPEVIEFKFKNALALVGLSFLNYYEKNKIIPENSDISVYDLLRTFSSAISPVLLPIISLQDM